GCSHPLGRSHGGIVVLAVAIVTGYVRRLLVAMVPTALIGAVVMRPVVENRLESFDISTGLPQSWIVRFDNLRLFAWLQVFSGETGCSASAPRRTSGWMSRGSVHLHRARTPRAAVDRWCPGS